MEVDDRTVARSTTEDEELAPAGPWESEPTVGQPFVVEVFAGDAEFSKACRKAGLRVAEPDDLRWGGTDFTDPVSVAALEFRLERWAKVANPLVLHLAPPCSTFSRARDRSARTRVRTRGRPGGIAPVPQFVKDANKVATEAYDLALQAAHDWKAWVSMENPASSYLWIYLGEDHAQDEDCKDVVLSACRFGAPFKKPTRLRCWNWHPEELSKTCVLSEGRFSCGRSKSEGHEVLEFGGRSTSTAASYWPGLTVEWAKAIKNRTTIPDTTEAAWESVNLTGEGKVKRHTARGDTNVSSKEARDAEDAASTAGCRNPAKVQGAQDNGGQKASVTDDRAKVLRAPRSFGLLVWQVVGDWPELREVMKTVEAVIRRTRLKLGASVQDLTDCFGSDPIKPPPSDELVGEFVKVLAETWNMSEQEAFETHPATTWRHNLVREVVRRSEDPDVFIADWLRFGAPMGLEGRIEPGGHFPRQASDTEITLEELSMLDRCGRNHPSFDELHGEAVSPAVSLVEEHLNNGHARLFADQASAEQWLGCEVFPAPMGNVTKVKGDKVKHRLIQDLRRNHVNRAVALPERQVLPRPIDHAVDVAILSHNKKADDELACMVLDFANAFMQIPLAQEEMKYNCASVPQGLSRTRSPLDEAEPASGSFVVWRVLGFGGRPNPLVYSRVASFAMRSAQALFPTSCSTRAKGRGQLYVDDPIVVVTGQAKEVRAALDVWLLWMLILGVPLAWKKGSITWGTDAHEWIGVVFAVDSPGVVRVELPKSYLDELLDLLEPFCKMKGHVAMKDAEKLVGKAGRVAHIVPTARPFVAALWGALTASKRAGRGAAKEAPPGRVACRRFATAAAWVRALVRGDPELDFPLQRLVTANRRLRARMSDWVAQFDASPWGGGGVLKYDGQVVEFFATKWHQKDFKNMDVTVGSSRSQTFFEFLTLFMTLLLWSSRSGDRALAIVGDNTAALSNAISLKGRGPLLAVSRELAWQRARKGWAFEVGHIPAEENEVADALSRLHAVPAKAFPTEALARAQEVRAPKVKTLWHALPDQGAESTKR